MLQDETKDINDINPSGTNDCLAIPMDDLECVSRAERVNDFREDGENLSHTRKFQGLDENQVKHMV
jgi:hypothetical protein